VDDPYLHYVKTLHARGYTIEQIQNLLVQEDLDRQRIGTLLAALHAPPETGLTVTSTPATGKQTAALLQAYVDYIKALAARGTALPDINKDLTERGVDVQSRAALFRLANRPPSAVSFRPAVPASPVKPAANAPANQSNTTRSDADRQVAEKTAVPTATQPAPKSTGEQTVPLHPATVSPPSKPPGIKHWVRSANELNDVGAEALTAVASLESPDEELDEAAEHLNKVADHLSEVADKMEAAEAAARPPVIPIMSGRPSSRIPQTENSGQPNQQQPASGAPPMSAGLNTQTAPFAIKAVSSKQGLLIIGIAAYAGVFAHALSSGEKTTTWLALISMNVVATVGFNFMLKRSSWHNLDQWLTATVLQTGLFLPFLAKEIVRPINFPTYTPFDFLLLGCASAALILLQFCNVKALQHLEASVFSVIYNSRIIFATLLGWVFLSEAVGLWALLGGLLIFTAIFVVRQRGALNVTRQGVLFGLGAALAISAMNTCEKELIKLVGYEQYIFPMFTIAAIVMWAVVFLRRTVIPSGLLLRPQSLLLMALRACAGISFSYSLVFGPVAVSSYLSSLSVVLMVVCGMLFLGERDYIKSKVWATVMAISGLTFILIDSFR
jgi:drug/metabolite transporter (DMT)-like permease